ncbi:FGGY family carbohydrate kinase, partial [Microbacterium sp. CPCC 204701]|uniref:FGGY family carbohydrate kinase n=1 Tax=Microbacterium sp. CPCC 204701 TaxID=2493084 RepID=UPI001F0C6C0C
MTGMSQTDVAAAIRDGHAVLGIELGSTRIKACLILADDPSTVLAVGSHSWENRFVGRLWTYSLEDVWTGLQAAYADLVADVRVRHGVALDKLEAIGVSAMMHGYLAFDEGGELLTAFRTWRNTNTDRASAVLSELFGINIPLRWSIAHLYQAVLDEEPHIPDVRFFTTLAGYVHFMLTGRKVLGIGDASGMFPIDSATRDYDAGMIEKFDRLVADRAYGLRVSELLPEVLVAGQAAGELTAEGAALLDPSGALRPGAVF